MEKYKDFTAIVMSDNNFAIGKDGNQPIYLPKDLEVFKNITMGKAIILGRKTLETFPNKKPLKGRRNFILSKSIENIEGATVCHSIEELLNNPETDGAFVVGGASIYKQLLPYCSHAIITHVYTDFDKPDAFFPDIATRDDWRLIFVDTVCSEKEYFYSREYWERKPI